MPKRASSEPFNRHTRHHIIPRLNALTGSSVDIAGSSRGLSANLSSLVQTTAANVDMLVSELVVSSMCAAQQTWQIRGIALSSLQCSREFLKEISVGLHLHEKRFLWCIAAILSYKEHGGRDVSADLLVAWALNELSTHLHLSGIVPGSSQDTDQAPFHPNDPYRFHHQRILASIEKADRDR